MTDYMIFSMICLIISFSAFIVAIIVSTVRSIRIRRYRDMCGVGCTVSKVIEPRNPFDKREIDEYVVVDKKWDHKGVCWVKLHRPFDKDLTCFDKTMTVENLYDKKYVISYKK